MEPARLRSGIGELFELLKREEKEIVVTLEGEELKGDYVLIRTKYGKGEKGWLFFKRAD